MLGSIFHKRKKTQDLRAPTLQDIKRFRDTYARNAERRCVEPPACLERSVYKAISGQRELHSVDFRQEDITDPQLVALAETLMELPLISSLDLRDNRITDDGAKALLEVLRLQIIAAKMPVKSDPKTRKPIFPVVPEYTKYVTFANLKGNEISSEVLQELAQYTDILRREDKRLEIRAALAQMDGDTTANIDEDEFKGVLKLLTGVEPSKKEVRLILQQYTQSGEVAQNALVLENVLLARCLSPTSNKAACPPWEALVQVRHANIGSNPPRPATASLPSSRESYSDSTSPMVDAARTQSYSSAYHGESPRLPIGSSQSVSSEVSRSSPRNEHQDSGMPVHPVSFADAPHPIPSVQVEDNPPSAPPPIIPPLVFSPPSPVKRRGSLNSARSSTTQDDDGSSIRPSLTKQQSRNSAIDGRSFVPVSSPTPSPRQAELVESPRLMVSSPSPPLTKQPREDSDKLPASALFNSDSPRFDNDDSFLDSARDDDLFSNDNSADDVLLSMLTQAPNRYSDIAPVQSTNNSDSRASSEPRYSFDDSADRSDDIERLLADVSSRDEMIANSGDKFEDEDDIHSSEDENDNSGVAPPVVDLADDHRTSAGTLGPDGDSGVQSRKQDEVSDDEEERDDYTEAEIMKDAKPRIVSKLINTSFKQGMRLTELPNELPFRNMLVLILSENKLRELTLFEECRFPCTIVLDLSCNRLSKVPDKVFAAFPRLQTLDLAHNQLKAISGVAESFKLRALNMAHNSLKSVTNIEHLTLLEVLVLSGNKISSVQSLRLVSFNKMLSRLELDGNPIVQTDERQRRKNITFILNLVPMLTSLGSIPCVSIQTKGKKKAAQPGSDAVITRGPPLVDSDSFPGTEKLWINTACELLGCFQDPVAENDRDRGDDDDDQDFNADSTTKKPLNRTQQRHKDEMRSRAVGYRSREKAIPSPPKAKTSVYSFGHPLPPPVPRQVKAKPAASNDPAVVRRQLRRSSELSAPKHPPVDTALLKQEQKRKSRPAFDLNMSVAERLLLAQEKAQRRPTKSLGRTNSSKSMSQSMLLYEESGAISSGATSSTNQDDQSGQNERRATSPRDNSPVKEVVAFRIEPPNSIRRQDVLEFRVEPARGPSLPRSPRVGSPRASAPTKEEGFLHSLAVGDFLNHATEEFSTALTALNVLLSMSEKEMADRSKLNHYRDSLVALGILNEEESRAMFDKTKVPGGHKQEEECAVAFERLGVVKRCMRQLLEKLETHEPGSAVIRAFCRSLRSTELKPILVASGEQILDSPTRPQEQTSDAVPAVRAARSEGNKEITVETNAHKDQTSQLTPQPSPQPSPSSLNTRLFASPTSKTNSLEIGTTGGLTQSVISVPEPANIDFESHTSDTTKGEESEFGADIDLDFLEPSTTTFGTDEDDVFGEKAVASLEDAGDETVSATMDSRPESHHVSSTSPATSDVTFDAQLPPESSDDDLNHWNDEALSSETLSASVVGNDEIESVPTTTAMDEPEVNTEGESNWLGNTTATDADADALEAILQSDSGEIDWDQHDEGSAVTNDDNTDSNKIVAGSVAEDDLFTIAGEGADDAEGAAFAEEITSEVYKQEEVVAEHVDEDDGGVTSSEFDLTNDESAIVEDKTTEYNHAVNATENEAEPGYAETEFEESTAYDGTDEVDNAPESYFEEDGTTAHGDEEYITQDGNEAEIEGENVENGEDVDDEAAEVFGDWEKGFDPNTNHYFWFNHETGESSWVAPEGWPYPVDDPFEGGDEAGADGEEGGEVVEEEAEEAVHYEGDTVAEDDAAEDTERTSEFIEASRVSEFEFDDSDLPGL